MKRIITKRRAEDNHTYNDEVIFLEKVFSVDRPPLGVVGCVMVVGNSCDEKRKKPRTGGRHAGYA